MELTAAISGIGGLQKSWDLPFPLPIHKEFTF